jgi:probable rRNA maturation factor
MSAKRNKVSETTKSGDAKIARLAGNLMKQLKVRGAPVVDIHLLPHAEIKALKARFIKKKTEPNVLAFPEPPLFPHPERKGKKYLGEIYLNNDILKKSPDRAAPLLLHGILHLLGYDHKRNVDAEKMEKVEAKILGRL